MEWGGCLQGSTENCQMEENRSVGEEKDVPRLHVRTLTRTHPHTRTHTHQPRRSENEIFQAAISAANSITGGTCTKSCDFPDGEIGKVRRAGDSE